MSFNHNLAGLPTGCLPSQLGGTVQPVRHQCLGVLNNTTQALSISHLFLPLWHRNNSFQSLEASLASLYPIHHKASLERMDLFHVGSPDCLSAAFITSKMPLCSPVLSVCQLQLPSMQAFITWDTGGHFFPHCSGTKGNSCAEQQLVKLVTSNAHFSVNFLYL